MTDEPERLHDPATFITSGAVSSTETDGGHGEALPSSHSIDETSVADLPSSSPNADTRWPVNPQSATEMRQNARHPFRYVQMMGTVNGDSLPSEEEFREVVCEDLSGGGMAMFLNHPPDFESCVIALGKPPNATYLLARVAHVQPVFRIGCQFLRRLGPDPITGELGRMSLRDEPSHPMNEDDVPR
jgi:hypothetical protein